MVKKKAAKQLVGLGADKLAQIELGGEIRTLRLDLNAMVNYEKATGKDFVTLSATTPSATDLRALLWACLLHENPQLTQSEVGSWIQASDMGALGETLKSLTSKSTGSKNSPESTGGKDGEAPLA